MAEKGRVAAPGLGMIGGAGVVGLMAAGALTAFLILVLSIFLPEWASALIVGAVLAAVAYVLVKQGKERVERGRQADSRTDHRDSEGGRGMGQDPSDIRAEIEQTRERVGDEVDALSYKTDVPARVGDYVDDKKQAVKDKVTGVNDAVTGTASRAMPSGEKVGRVKDTAERNPLGLAVGGAAVGFVAGLAAAVDAGRERADGRDVRPRRGRGQGHGRRGRRARQAGRPGRGRDREGERPRAGPGARLEPAGTGTRVDRQRLAGVDSFVLTR